MNAQIVILNYKGDKLLPQCLPSIVEAANQSPCLCRVVVLNNPSDGADGLDYVRREYPQVQIVQAPQNKVLCSYNGFLRSSTADVSILLNNDIRVESGFVAPLVKAFESNPRLFLAAPKTMSFDGKTVEAADSRAEIRFGLFWCSARYPGYEAHVDQAGPTFSSGFGAFRTEVFNLLGGYDERYLPGIYEDVDLCLRAKKAGYELVYEPSSIVYHMGQASFKDAFKQRGLEVLAARNQFLFLWKNYKGWLFWTQHFLWLPLRLIFTLIRRKTALWEGFRQAWMIQRNRS